MIARDVTITKVDAEDQPAFSYTGEIVYQDEQMLIARCPWPSAQIVDLGPFALEPGDILMEYYYRSHWFNVFVVYDAAGVRKGWYCNITYPVEVLAQEIHWRDLALDLLVLPDGTDRVLDRDEFEAIPLSPQVRRRAEQALATLQCWARQGRGPFNPLAPRS